MRTLFLLLAFSTVALATFVNSRFDDDRKIRAFGLRWLTLRRGYRNPPHAVYEDEDEIPCLPNSYLNQVTGRCEQCLVCPTGQYVEEPCGERADTVCSECSNPSRKGIDYWSKCVKSIQQGRIVPFENLMNYDDSAEESIEEEIPPMIVDEENLSDEEESFGSAKVYPNIDSEEDEEEMRWMRTVDEDSDEASVNEESPLDNDDDIVRQYVQKAFFNEKNMGEDEEDPLEKEEKNDESIFAEVEARMKTLEKKAAIKREKEEEFDQAIQEEEVDDIDENDEVNDFITMKKDEMLEKIVGRKVKPMPQIEDSESDEEMTEAELDEEIVAQKTRILRLFPSQDYEKQPLKIVVVDIGSRLGREEMEMRQASFSNRAITCIKMHWRRIETVILIGLCLLLAGVAILYVVLPICRRRSLVASIRRPMTPEQQRIINSTYHRLVEDKNPDFAAVHV